MTVLALLALALGALSVIVAAAYRRRRPDPTTHLLDDEEAAYLSGGPVRVLNTALYRLAETGAVRISRDHRVSKVDGARPGGAVEADLLAVLDFGSFSCGLLRSRGMRGPRLRKLERRLSGQNLIAPGPYQVRLFGSAALAAAVAVLILMAGSDATRGPRTVVAVVSFLVAGLAIWTLLPARRKVDGLLAAYDQRRGDTPVARVARRGLAEVPDDTLRSTLVAGLAQAGTGSARRFRRFGSRAAAGSAFGYGYTGASSCGSGGDHHSCGGGGHHSCGGGSSCGGGGSSCGGGSS